MIDTFEEQSSPNFEQLWSMVRRGRWSILLPLFLCWLIAWSISWFIPTAYDSEALILIEQQKVPEHYVVANVSVSLDERLQTLTQQVLSRTRLQSIIEQLHLYPPQTGWRKLIQLDDPVEAMRKDIKIDLVEPEEKGRSRPEGPTAFKITYSAASPELAQQVNLKLTDQFINESMNAQREMSQSTTAFLDNQLQDAAKRLDEQEERVRTFKATHLGDLPSQLQSNVEILSGLQAQLQNVQHAIDSAKQQKLYLESQLQQLQMFQSALGGDVSQIEVLQKELLELRKNLADERSGHTEDYPDIVALKGKIAQTEKLINDLVNPAASEKQTTASGTASDPNNPILSSPLMQVRSQLKANELEIKDYERQQKTILGKIADYQARLNLTPKTEQELAEVSRGYEESKIDYDALLQKSNQSKLATSLEQRAGGEQFRILDPPTLPDKPRKPIHLFLSLGGLAVGGFLGVILLALKEVTNASVHHEDDIDGVVPGRVLVRIPHLDTPHEIRIRAASRLLELTAVIVMVLLIVAGNLYTFYKG